MKKITAIVLALAFSVISYGQAQITTKKVKIEDFMEKTIKVVTSGNMFFDQALKDEVMNRWRISPASGSSASLWRISNGWRS